MHFVQMISGVITLAVLAGLGYYFFTRSGVSDDDDTGDSGPSKKRTDDDMNDPLSDAQRIM
jgi:hypothetical protein